MTVGDYCQKVYYLTMIDVERAEVSWMAVYYDGISLQNQRKVNMDSLLLKKRVLSGQALCLAAVCDGVGSLDRGALAASLAVRMLSTWFEELESVNRIGLQLRDRVMEIHQRVSETARGYQIRTASTLSALLLDEARYYVVHLGDSRIYCLRDGILERLTKDQACGNCLTSYLGQDKQPDILYNEDILREGLFLLCTDGLYKQLDDMFIQRELTGKGKKHLKKTVGRLAECAVERGERDNISLALVLKER